MPLSQVNRIGPTLKVAHEPPHTRLTWWRHSCGWVSQILQSEADRRQMYEVREDLLHVLYGRPATVLLVGISGATCGVYATFRAGVWSAMLLGLIGLFLVLVRHRCIIVFRRRFLKTRCGDLAPWFAAFALTAIGSSLAWGALTFVCLATTQDPILYTAVLTCDVTAASAIAARNAAAPRVARLQVLVMLLPVMAAVPLTGRGSYGFLLLLVPVVLYGLSVLITDINQQLVQSYRSQLKLSILSTIDYLTQIPNRRFFGERAAAALDHCNRARQPMAILMIDVDFFKSFNDHYGHQAGDRCLQNVALILRDNLRHDGDIVSRYGGEEFAVSLQNASMIEAERVAQRLCDAVAAARLSHAHRPDGVSVVTISIGVVTTGDSHADLDALVRSADQALYEAKRTGRNRISLAPGCEARQHEGVA
jgi:diguanylate cyclase (GGDEF)-like protein